MMKTHYILPVLTGLILAASATSCEDEKDLIIVEGNLPIKTSTLYMVGDATPSGWSIDTPTSFEATEEDPLVFLWEGSLNTGELKLCLTTGSWDAAFIRPKVAGTEISSTAIDNAEFKMHAGDPDDKWVVTEAGVYNLTFDLRNWTMSTAYISAPPAAVIEPIKADAVYIVGDAAPCGWNIDAPLALEKVSEYLFRYEGQLNKGELKACTTTGSWDASFIRPSSNGVVINKQGVAASDFVYTASPDNKWIVEDAGNYVLEFNLETWTVSATFTGEIVNDRNPIETSTLFMIGDATPGGWSMDDATEFTRDSDNGYIFTWEGELVEGSMKACTERDGTFSCPFIRPASANVEISSNGVASPEIVYTTSPDDQWKITEAGTYRIVFDLENLTISATKTTSSNPGEEEPTQPEEPGEENPDAIETSTLFMIGDATPGGWSMDDASSFTVDSENKYIFTWEGKLTTGEMKACLQPDGTFSCPFIRPTSDGVKIGKDGVEDPHFVYTTDPDHKWKITDEGNYRIIFDLENLTIEAKYLD